MGRARAAGGPPGQGRSEDARLTGVLLGLARNPRWPILDPRTLVLSAACVLTVTLPLVLFEHGSGSYATAAEAAHVVLLVLLVFVGLRMPLVAGLVLAGGCEVILAAGRVAYGSGPRALVVIWAVLGPSLVSAVWFLSEYPRMVGRAEARAAIVALARAIAANHEGTGEHSGDVVELSLEVGRRMGLAGRDLDDLELAAQLHDVGKIGIPHEVLNKPGPLDHAETALIRRHPDLGADLVAQVRPLASIAPAVRAMHERWDGDGYPAGLAGEDIPRISRIVFACDAYCAMRQERPYQAARDAADAWAELRRCSGSQFDPAVVRVLLEVLAPRNTAGIAPPGGGTVRSDVVA